LARRWKLEVLPANAARIAAGVGMEQICSSLVRAGNRLYTGHSSRALAVETLVAAEENRAWALRTVLASGSRMETAMPQEYWETLTRLQRAETAYLATSRPEANRQAEHMRARLTEMEASAGLSGVTSKQPAATAESSLLTRLQRALSGSDALFIFHTDETESWAWVTTNSYFALYKVPGRDALRPLVLQLREGVLRNSPDAPVLGGKLYRALFARAPKAALAKRDWIVVADDVLHHAPLAALATGRDGRNPQYLIEKHSLRSAPAAGLIGRAPTATIGNRFVGIGDAVFNTADPRWHGSSEDSSAGGWWRAWLSWLPHFHAQANDAEARAVPALQLARLAGSLNEIRACAHAWGKPYDDTVLLTGTDASSARLHRELIRQPGIVHIATHVVRGRKSPDRVGLALSLTSQAQVELLTPETIAAWRYPVGLVVLSACSSGSQPAGEDAARLVRATEYSVHTGTGARLALPGEGIAGLSRAWLAAGAKATAASLWPTPDDTGQLFRSFYSDLRGTAGPGVSLQAARALRKAQLEMLHSASWRAQPRYWAAFVITGKE
ncbi:MAG: CHAT domain-containing protein, partial [Bryobacteraceae bacterium]